MGMMVGSQKRFLCNYRIPAQLRVKVLESVVLTSGLYGAEVWGGNKRNARLVQKELYKGLNYILQGTRNFSFRMYVIATTGVGFTSGVSYSGG